MTKRELTCIVCPRGCSLVVELDDNGAVMSVSGNICKRGNAYANDECTNPMRVVTSTVRCEDGRVVAVKFTDELKSSAVCMSYEGEVSLEMEKVFKSMKTASPMPVEAKKVLEININHQIAGKLKDAYENDKDKLDKYAEILFVEALMLAGFEPEDVNQFTTLINSLL